MQEDAKGVWELHKRKIIVGAAIALIIIGIYSFRIWTEAQILLGKSLIVTVSPGESSVQLQYGQQQNITFTVTAAHARPCAALCTYEFQDTSGNRIRDAGTILLQDQESVQRTYQLAVSRLGTGQDLYNFQVRCIPKESLLCPATAQETFRSSLVIVNYDLNELQRQRKEALAGDITAFLTGLAETDLLLQQSGNAVFTLSKAVSMGQLRQEKESISASFDRLRIAAENFRITWAEQDYLGLDRQFNQSFLEEVQALRQRIIQLNQSASALLSQHNAVAGQLKAFHRQYLLAGMGNATSTPTERQLAESLGPQYQLLLAAMENQTAGYPELMQESASLLDNFSLAAAAIANRSMLQAMQGEYLVTEEQGLRCLLENCTSFPMLEAEPELNASCAAARGFVGAYGLDQSRAKNATAGAEFPEDPAFAQYVADKARHYRELLRTAYRPVPGYASVVPPENPVEFAENPEFEQYNVSLYYYAQHPHDPTINGYLREVCIPPSPPLPLIPDAPPLQEFPRYAASSTIETVLPDALPMCCVFGQCQPCCHGESCRNDPDTFPVVLLHGHSVLSGSSPEYSLDAFNRIQYRLQQDGYINAGILSLASLQQGSAGEWGISGKPVTVKVSYYYDAFQRADEYIVVPTKSETIDTYAVRLRELVDAVKEKTGKPKVKIIANSMGGLVARRYIQIFGEDSVQLLLMTGTPNKGIVGRVRDFCPLLGEGLECRDMQEGSLFLSKLNDPGQQPLLPMYIIAGSGCSMDGEDGDGIVLLDHALIPNARQFIINGTCPGAYSEPLHTAMLDIGRYPEVYGIIRDVLAG